MELRQLQYLITCAETKSFSKAASILFTSQSNVSKTIAALEKELGSIIFERKQHGIEITEKGKQIYQYAIHMMECSEKIKDCAEREEAPQLRVSFQPDTWFADAFCAYYTREGGDTKRYQIISAQPDEIIRRISGNLDQLGFFYIEDTQLGKLQDLLRTSHIGHYELLTTRNILYNAKGSVNITGRELRLIQECDEAYSGISFWKESTDEQEESSKPKVIITTNSDHVLQEILDHTDLCQIRPAGLYELQKAQACEHPGDNEHSHTIKLICIFRNDQTLEKLPKEFLSFYRRYISEHITK